MIVCLSVCLSICLSVCLCIKIGIHFFIGLYLFNTATDRVYFWHACTLGPGLYSPNVFGDAALMNYANYAKSVSPSTFWYTLFLHFGIHFFTFWYTLFYQFISF